MTDKPTPTDAEILDAAEDFRSQYTHGGTTFDEFDEIGFARAVLAKWGQPAQAEEPVAWLRNTTDQIADYVADNWPMRKYDLSEIEQRLRMLASAPSGPAREPLDESRRLFDAGWKACANFCDRDDVAADGIIGFGACQQFEAAFSAANGIKGGQHGTK